jgi:hypothetical protein
VAIWTPTLSSAIVMAATAEQRLRLGPGCCGRRRQLGDDPAAAHDRGVLADLLDAVEQVGEAPRGLGCAHLRHVCQMT